MILSCVNGQGTSKLRHAPQFDPIAAKVYPAQLPIGEAWSDPTLDVSGRWRNTFTDEMVEGDRLALRESFAFPVAIPERA